MPNKVISMQELQAILRNTTPTDAITPVGILVKGDDGEVALMSIEAFVEELGPSVSKETVAQALYQDYEFKPSTINGGEAVSSHTFFSGSDIQSLIAVAQFFISQDESFAWGITSPEGIIGPSPNSETFLVKYSIPIPGDLSVMNVVHQSLLEYGDRGGDDRFYVSSFRYHEASNKFVLYGYNDATSQYVFAVIDAPTTASTIDFRTITSLPILNVAFADTDVLDFITETIGNGFDPFPEDVVLSRNGNYLMTLLVADDSDYDYKAFLFHWKLAAPYNFTTPPTLTDAVEIGNINGVVNASPGDVDDNGIGTYILHDVYTPDDESIDLLLVQPQILDRKLF